VWRVKLISRPPGASDIAVFPLGLLATAVAFDVGSEMKLISFRSQR
jgi:hypothetical protein